MVDSLQSPSTEIGTNTTGAVTDEMTAKYSTQNMTAKSQSERTVYTASGKSKYSDTITYR